MRQNNCPEKVVSQKRLVSLFDWMRFSHIFRSISSVVTVSNVKLLTLSELGVYRVISAFCDTGMPQNAKIRWKTWSSVLFGEKKFYSNFHTLSAWLGSVLYPVLLIVICQCVLGGGGAYICSSCKKILANRTAGIYPVAKIFSLYISSLWALSLIFLL